MFVFSHDLNSKLIIVWYSDEFGFWVSSLQTIAILIITSLTASSKASRAETSYFVTSKMISPTANCPASKATQMSLSDRHSLRRHRPVIAY